MYPILFTYKNKLSHSVREFTPSDARKTANKLMKYINMKLKAKHNRRYQEIHIGDHVSIYDKKQIFH